MNSLKCFSIKSAERVISESVNLRRKPTPWSQIYISNMANTTSSAWVVFCYCNKTPETTCRVKNTCVTSLFLSFQAVISWPCCFGPTARQQRMVGAGGRTNPPSSQPGNRKEWREGPVSPIALQGNRFYDPKIPSWDSTCLQVPLPPTSPGAQTFTTWAFENHTTPSWSETVSKPTPFFFANSEKISIWKLIHQNCNTCQVCQFNKVERKLVDAHRKHHRYWTEGPTCGPSQHTDVCTGHTGLRLMVLLLPLILLFHNG